MGRNNITAEPGSEPIQGKELIRLGLETYQVRFELEDWGLYVGATFWLTTQGGTEIRIDPVAHTGELAALWPLIGERVQAVSWADDIDIVFTGGARLRIPASPDHAPRGTLLGRAGDNHLVEDF